MMPKRIDFDGRLLWIKDRRHFARFETDGTFVDKVLIPENGTIDYVVTSKGLLFFESETLRRAPGEPRSLVWWNPETDAKETLLKWELGDYSPGSGERQLHTEAKRITPKRKTAMVYCPINDIVYIRIWDQSTLSCINPETRTTIREIDLSRFDPIGLDLTPLGELVVYGERPDSKRNAYILDPSGHKIESPFTNANLYRLLSAREGWVYTSGFDREADVMKIYRYPLSEYSSLRPNPPAHVFP